MFSYASLANRSNGAKSSVPTATPAQPIGARRRLRHKRQAVDWIHPEPSTQGQPLAASLRSTLEPRYQEDFSQVRIHTNGDAQHMASGLHAKAFTVGTDVFFNRGQFNPTTTSGKRLLSHELAHVVQQQKDGPRIQRAPEEAPPKADLAAEAANLEAEILGLPQYLALDKESKGRVKEIIRRAAKRPPGEEDGQRNYYLKNLRKALTTPYTGKSTGKATYGCSEKTAAKNRATVEAALKEEQRWGGAYSDVDEEIVATGKKKVARRGKRGKLFYVDRSDPRNVRVLIKVRLVGLSSEVGRIEQLEDAIEREVSMSTKGYFFDIVFVDKPGPDVFEFTVKFCEWPNAGNWASAPVVLSHEVHHALGLDDRYDYIKSHAGNRDMNVEMRLVWYLEQMKKEKSPRDPYSKMSKGNNPLLAEDVCAVAFPEGRHRDKCVEARKDLDAPNIPALK